MKALRTIRRKYGLGWAIAAWLFIYGTTAIIAIAGVILAFVAGIGVTLLIDYVVQKF
jgi:hypothetical protein